MVHCFGYCEKGRKTNKTPRANEQTFGGQSDMKTLHTTASVNNCKVITFTVFEEMYSSINLTKHRVLLEVNIHQLH